MSDRPIEPIPLWRHDQRLAMACALVAGLLVLASLYLLTQAYEQRLQLELHVADAAPPPPATS